MATRTIGTELVLSGEKTFNDGMKAVNSNLKNLKSDMALVTAEFNGNADSMEALTAKQKVLQSSVEQHRAKVDALQRMYDQQKKQYGENSAQADKYRQQLNNATVALLKEQKALDKTTKAIDEQKKESKKLKDATKDSTKETEKAAKSQEKLKKAASATKTALSGVGKAAIGMHKAVGVAAVATAAGVLAVGAASAAAFAAVVGWAKEQAEAAKAASEAGEQLSDSQKQWLDFSKQLDSLDSSAENAKSAIAGILLPLLRDLTEQGSQFLSTFASDMTEATGDTQRQMQILGRYIAEGARAIISQMPDYVAAGKEVLGGIVDGFGEAAKEGDLLELGFDLIMELLHFIEKEAPALVGGGLELVLQILTGFEGQDVGETVALFVRNLFNAVADKAPNLIPAGIRLVLEILKGTAMNYGDLLKAAGELVIAIKDGIIAGLAVLEEVGPEIVDELITSLKSSDSAALQWGGRFIEKIKLGITEGIPQLIAEIGEVLAPVFDVFRVGWDGFIEAWQNAANGRFQLNGKYVPFADLNGSHKNGLTYVPYDGYLAELHRGEQVLTAQEAAAYRSGQGGKVFNMTIHTTSISKEDMDMLVDYMNGKLGDALP